MALWAVFLCGVCSSFFMVRAMQASYFQGRAVGKSFCPYKLTQFTSTDVFELTG